MACRPWQCSLGGHVEASNEREFGYAQVEVVNDSALVRGIEDALTADGKPLLDVWMSHGDKVTAIPSDFITVASTESCPFAIMANEEKRFYGVQFHPEVTHTRQGMRMLERFVRDICQCEALVDASENYRRCCSSHPRAGRRR